MRQMSHRRRCRRHALILRQPIQDERLASQIGQKSRILKTLKCQIELCIISNLVEDMPHKSKFSVTSQLGSTFAVIPQGRFLHGCPVES